MTRWKSTSRDAGAAQAFGKGKSARLWMNESRYKFATGTFSRVWLLGGDLMDQAPHEAHEFIRDLRKAMKPGMELWLWTGHELDDIPLRLRYEFDWIKTGDYREDLPSIGVAYDGHDGKPRPLVLASSNQQLHRITEPCPHPETTSSNHPSLMKMKPGLTRELVEGLDALVPERCPGLKQPEREIWMYAGKRELVRNLITVLERQERERTRNPHLGLMPRLS